MIFNSASKGIEPCLPKMLDVIYLDLFFEVSAWRCSSTATGDVLFGNLGTCGLVIFLPTGLACGLLAELDAYRCVQMALALVDI